MATARDALIDLFDDNHSLRAQGNTLVASAYRYADLARALVTDLPESDERRALLWMPDFVVARDK